MSVQPAATGARANLSPLVVYEQRRGIVHPGRVRLSPREHRLGLKAIADD
jgi:hypothetical protein